MLGTVERKCLVTLGCFLISGLGMKRLGQEAKERCWENSNVEGGFYSVGFGIGCKPPLLCPLHYLCQTLGAY